MFTRHAHLAGPSTELSRCRGAQSWGEVDPSRMDDALRCAALA
jgi:hypothetical protein